MKKIINRVEDIVSEMLEGMMLACPDLKVLPGTQVVVRKSGPVPGKVGLISGGGSGHEPAHAGYVGEGMLDAACAGALFSSPSVDQMMEGIRAIHTGKGVLIIAKNYTGDNLNFDMAAELLADEGIRVEKVVVKDDVAVEESENTTGRRGVAGTVFVHKIAGAKAAAGADLDEVKAVAEKAVANVHTFGFALSPCIIPSVGKPSFHLEENEMELGTGIHGEAGVERMQIPLSVDLAEILVEKLEANSAFARNDEVAVMVNGCGATPLMELYILMNDVAKALKKRQVTVYRSFVGNYMTSLEMAGGAVSILKLDDELKQLLDAKADTPGFHSEEYARKSPIAMDCLKEVCTTLISKKDLLNELDAVMGDGEHGSNIERSFGMVCQAFSELEELDTIQLIDRTGSILLEAGGGTATTLIGFGCKKTAALAKKAGASDAKAIAEVMEKTKDSIQLKSKAVVGDKTLMDAYIPAVDAFVNAAGTGASTRDCFAAAAAAAQKGAEATKEMVAKRGRGYYVGERGIGTADPGATSVAIIFETIHNSLNKGD